MWASTPTQIFEFCRNFVKEQNNINIERNKTIMAQISPHTRSGFMELLPAPQAQMEAMMDILRRTYSLYGFCALDTPAIEAADVLLAKGGGETEKQIYRFQKGDSDLALRFDLTVPLAKYVALHYNRHHRRRQALDRQ